MMAVFMEAARSADVADRVISYHSSLGVLEWPSVVFDGIRYPGVSELAATQRNPESWDFSSAETRYGYDLGFLRCSSN